MKNTIFIFLFMFGCDAGFKSTEQFASDDRSSDQTTQQPLSDSQFSDQRGNFSNPGNSSDNNGELNSNDEIPPDLFGDGEIANDLDGGSGFKELPGQETNLVSISFEDGSDGDYNDVSFCFEGVFKVEGKTVLYSDREEKTITVTVKRLTGNHAVFTLNTLDDNGDTVYQKSGPLDFQGQTITLNVPLKYGHKIKARYDKAGDFHDMPGSNSKVLIDQCKNTGG